ADSRAARLCSCNTRIRRVGSTLPRDYGAGRPRHPSLQLEGALLLFAVGDTLPGHETTTRRGPGFCLRANKVRPTPSQGLPRRSQNHRGPLSEGTGLFDPPAIDPIESVDVVDASSSEYFRIEEAACELDDRRLDYVNGPVSLRWHVLH